MPNITFTVIIPTYNRAEYLSCSIESILRQHYPAQELIVIDDGSTDDTSRLCKEYKNKITYLRKTNSGKAASLNIALKRASGDVIYVLDDDDLALPSALKLHANALAANPTASYSYGPLLWGHEYGHPKRIRVERRPAMASYTPRGIYVNQLIENDILHPCIAIRRDCLNEIGGFDESFDRCQDYEMILRVTRHFSGVQITKPIYIHRLHAGLRGTSNRRFSLAERASVSLDFDRRAAIQQLRSTTNDELVVDIPKILADETSKARIASLRRGIIFGRKGDWRSAVIEFRELPKQRAFHCTDQESENLRRLLGSRRANRYLFRRPNIAFSIPFIIARVYGVEGIKDVARGLYWQVAKSHAKFSFHEFFCWWYLVYCTIVAFCVRLLTVSRRS